MAEETTTPTGEETLAVSPSTAPTPQAGTTTPSEPQAGETQQEIISLEEAKKLRSEAQNLRKRLKGYEDAERTAQEAQMSELDRTKKQYADLQAQHEREVADLRDRIVRYEVERTALSLNIVDPDAAARLIDWSSLEFDEDSTPKNAKKLLEALVKAKPYLIKQQEQPQGTPAPTPAQSASTGQVVPALPGMNPGRAQITPPSQIPTGKIPSLSEVYQQSRRR